jgi:polyvinyl alcohol dehydrogenase (cytochrome)
MIEIVLLLASAQQAPGGAAIYARHCARCHEVDKTGWAAKRDVLSKLPPEAILAQLHLGFMSVVATLTDEDKRAVASYLSGKPAAPFRMPPMPPPENLCAAPARAPDLLSGPMWNSWGVDSNNSRFQPSAAAGIAAADVPRLKLKWAFGFPNAVAAWAQPVVAGGRLFAGSANGNVYSLDARTGCTHWIHTASPAGVRSAITIAAGASTGSFVAYFGDLAATAYAVDAITGTEIWKTKIDDHPVARITGAPQLHDGKLYVPVASIEEATAINPKYECCTFRGSVVALDARTGKQIWKTYMIPNPPRQTGRNSAGTPQWGPSGAGVWSAPTVDAKRGVLYATTGDHFSDPEEGHGDSVVALDLATGKVVWVQKTLKGDRWNAACLSGDKVNCPKNAGPDHDFGASAILHTLADGRRVLLAGQKTGVLHFLDPDRNGAIIRQVRVSSNPGLLGGIEWGPAADPTQIYVSVADYDPNKPESGGGLTAFQISTGERVWHVPAPRPPCLGQRGCSASQAGAVTAIPGVVFTGSIDGHLRAYATADGKPVVDLDLRRPFPTVNNVPANGGSLSGPGPTVAGGMLYVNSGYGLLHGAPGNVLLAFSVDGK